MKLSCFDGKIVKITLDNGDVFEGECVWCSSEYCEAELGRDEEALQIDDWVFYENDISSVELSAEKDEYIWLGKTEHRMKLGSKPFYMIESGLKKIELRLYDEKRRRIKAGDIIRFENTEDDSEILRAEVKELYVFGSFAELYAELPLLECGCTDENIITASPNDMNVYYSAEKQKLYGVVGLRLELI